MEFTLMNENVTAAGKLSILVHTLNFKIFFPSITWTAIMTYMFYGDMFTLDLPRLADIVIASCLCDLSR